MPFFLIRQDITKMHVDAIVNAANHSLLGGGGVDGAIHRAAGRGLLQECRELGGCDTGDAKRTGAYDLPCKYVIHTVGPIWHGGECGEQQMLRSCYARSLQIAAESECESVAFPLISAGVYGYPKSEAIRIASETIRSFLQTHDMTVYLVLFDRGALTASEERFGEIRRILSEKDAQTAYPNEPRNSFTELDRGKRSFFSAARKPKKTEGSHSARPEECGAVPLPAAALCEAAVPSLESMLKDMDESFAQTLFRFIDRCGMTDAQCYKKANIDRKLFSKIRSNPQYKPSKNTAIAFAVALELSLEETKELLRKAGYALSRSNTFDIIIEYSIRTGQYDVFEINETLFAFDQTLLGA